MKHDFDDMQYCRRCGISLRSAVKQQQNCKTNATTVLHTDDPHLLFEAQLFGQRPHTTLTEDKTVFGAARRGEPWAIDVLIATLRRAYPALQRHEDLE